ncbi:MAG TPA: hypothetical protein V6D29_23740 [Leptolyngbyaceae cyanobacterium]
MSKAAALAQLPPQAKPHINLLPKDPLESKFCQLFPHPWDWIKSEGNGWKTITQYPLQPRDLIRYWKDPHTLVGVSFDTDTAYGVLDLDIGGDYHPLLNPTALEGIKAALEDVGLTRTLLLQSSESEGVWLLLPLPEAVSSFRLAQVLHGTLKKAGFDIRPGHLEVFPNLKHWDAAYHAHRLPLQGGSYLLDEDLQPYSNRLEDFLDAWESAAAGQDIDTLKEALGSHGKIKPTSRESERARAFREDLQSRINEGWTGDAQTNDLLLDIGRMCRVFHRLGGNLLAKKILSMAQSLPGYEQHCDHQHEIDRRAKEVARWAEKHYQPIGYGQAITEPMAPKGPNNQDKAKDAQERIKAAVATLEATAEPPTTVTQWRDAIASQGISPHTLYKYKYLWHPECRIKAVSTSIPSIQRELFSPTTEEHLTPTEMPEPLKNVESIDPAHKKCIAIEEAPPGSSQLHAVDFNPHAKKEFLPEKPEQMGRCDQGSQFLGVDELSSDLEHMNCNPVYRKQVFQARQHQELGQAGLPNPEYLEVTSRQLEAAGILGYSASPNHGWTFYQGELSPRLWNRLRQVVFSPLMEL